MTLKDFTSLETAYKAVKMNTVSEGLIAISTLIAVIIILSKLSTAYKEAFMDEKPANAKHILNQFWIYIMMLGLICGAPVLFSLVEKGLGKMQDELVNKYSGDVDMNIDAATAKYTESYIKEEVQTNDTNPLKFVMAKWWADQQKGFYIFMLYVTKYTFFFFAAGRYLYLILLEIVAPLAIVCFISDNLRQYAMTYLKHLMVCYLMIPAFLIANTFGTVIGQVFVESFNSYSIMGILASWIIKASLMKKAQTYVKELI